MRSAEKIMVVLVLVIVIEFRDAKDREDHAKDRKEEIRMMAPQRAQRDNDHKEIQ